MLKSAQNGSSLSTMCGSMTPTMWRTWPGMKVFTVL